MKLTNPSGPISSVNILIENTVIHSKFLEREVRVDLYFPPHLHDLSSCSLLLVNDGQDMEKLGLKKILEELYTQRSITPLLIAGIHASVERKAEYGVAGHPDYHGRGAKASHYTLFIMNELLPFVQKKATVQSFAEKSFAGFSLGGLMALDIVWNHPGEFKKAGIFSGSLWWRNVDQNDKKYSDDQHRIMHQQIKKGDHHPGLKFFFTTGSQDETRDRNNNGIIDSIDDTIALITELEKLGYKKGQDIFYINYEDGRHDIATWARGMPEFLKWGWGFFAKEETSSYI